MENTNRILPPTYFLFYLAAAIILHVLVPIVYIISAPFTYLGIAVMLFGLVITFWADNIFKRVKTTVQPFEKSTVLVTEGPFRLSRHPMYLGFVSVLLGLAILLGSVVSFLSPIAMFVTLQMRFMPYEEKDMEAVFGAEYAAYKNRVRRWL